MHIVTMTLIALVVAAPAVAQAQVQVHVDIGIHLPAPPRLVVVPQVPAVRYVAAPAAPGNLFLAKKRIHLGVAPAQPVGACFKEAFLIAGFEF